MGMRVAVVDNYDSFVYNLVQYLGELGSEPVVVRNDAVDVAGIRALEADALLVSPGPGRPEDAGVSSAAIADLGAEGFPVLGVCLGHQCIGQNFGARISRAPEIVHGKSSAITTTGGASSPACPRCSRRRGTTRSSSTPTRCLNASRFPPGPPTAS